MHHHSNVLPSFLALIHMHYTTHTHTAPRRSILGIVCSICWAMFSFALHLLSWPFLDPNIFWWITCRPGWIGPHPLPTSSVPFHAINATDLSFSLAIYSCGGAEWCSHPHMACDHTSLWLPLAVSAVLSVWFSHFPATFCLRCFLVIDFLFVYISNSTDY